MERELEAEAGRVFCRVMLDVQKKDNVVFFIRIDKSLLKRTVSANYLTEDKEWKKMGVYLRNRFFIA